MAPSTLPHSCAGREHNVALLLYYRRSLRFQQHCWVLFSLQFLSCKHSPCSHFLLRCPSMSTRSVTPRLILQACALLTCPAALFQDFNMQRHSTTVPASTCLAHLHRCPVLRLQPAVSHHDCSCKQLLCSRAPLPCFRVSTCSVTPRLSLQVSLLVSLTVPESKHAAPHQAVNNQACIATGAVLQACRTCFKLTTAARRASCIT